MVLRTNTKKFIVHNLRWNICFYLTGVSNFFENVRERAKTTGSALTSKVMQLGITDKLSYANSKIFEFGEIVVNKGKELTGSLVEKTKEVGNSVVQKSTEVLVLNVFYFI